MSCGDTPAALGGDGGRQVADFPEGSIRIAPEGKKDDSGFLVEVCINEVEGPVKKYATVGACGLDCGLCTRYYTVGKSRCPGCCGPDFFNKHPSCSFITCCVKKRNLEVCAECPEFPCSKFKSEEEYLSGETSSYAPDRRILPNLNFIKEQGIEKFVEQQRKRIKLLEIMIENFNDGRSRSFFCRAAGLLDLTGLESSLDKASRKVEAENIKPRDVKGKAKILRGLLDEVAINEGIELKLAKSPKQK